MKNFDLEKYKFRIKNINWTNLYNSKDITLSYNIFETEILNILNEEAPLSTIQVRNNHKRWVTDSTKVQIQNKELARELARSTQNPLHWQSYRALRNACTSSLRKDKTLYHKNLYKNLKLNKILQVYTN